MVKKIEAYQTTDGTLFLSELEAYKYECDYLSNMVSNPINIRKNKEVLPDFITVSGIRIEFEKCYKITDLMPCLSFNSCDIPHSPGIYMWYNKKERKGYVGSAEDLFRRCADFIRFDSRYAGEKLETARQKYKEDFVYLLIETINQPNVKLYELEKFYIEKYDTIKNGYNTAIPHETVRKGVTCTEEEKKEKQRIKSAEATYNTIIKYIKEWGMKVGSTLTLENWTKIYNFNHSSYNFRLPCFIEKTNIVDFSSLLDLGNVMKMLLDKPHYGYRTETDMFPSSMIRYRQSDKKYLAIGNDSRTFTNEIDALTYYVEEHIRIKIISLLDRCDKDIRDKVFPYVKSASFEDLIRLKYKDSEKILNYLAIKKEKIEEDLSIATSSV